MTSASDTPDVPEENGEDDEAAYPEPIPMKEATPEEVAEVVKSTMEGQIKDDPEAFKKKWGLDDLE
jgi:hypothetical protein